MLAHWRRWLRPWLDSAHLPSRGCQPTESPIFIRNHNIFVLRLQKKQKLSNRANPRRVGVLQWFIKKKEKRKCV